MDWEKLWEQLVPLAAGWAVRIVGVLFLLFIAWIVAGWVRRLVLRGLRKAKIDETLTRFLAKMAGWLVLLLAVLACLSVFGVETTSFAAVIGAAGLAVGLAFQGSLSNFAAGVLLLVLRPFNVGDVVTAGGQTGKIEAIELFTTTMDTFDNRRFIIPNSAIIGSVIENISHHPRRRADVAVGTSYDADIDRTLDILTEAAKSVPGGLDEPAPAVILLELADSSVNWSVRVWANAEDFGAVKQATIRAVKMALDEASIGIPFPQMDVHLEQAAAG